MASLTENAEMSPEIDSRSIKLKLYYFGIHSGIEFQLKVEKRYLGINAYIDTEKENVAIEANCAPKKKPKRNQKS